MSGAYRRGVGIFLLNEANRVFVGRRIDTVNAWQMPQGGIDAGETPRVAALRELQEEVGTDKAEIIAETADWLRYDLPVPLVGRVWSGRYRGQEQKWFAMRFKGRDEDIRLDRHEPEFNAWQWVEPARLTEGAEQRGDGTILYAAAQARLL
jgi:putative (di)nucleoside polyphosphate hydrolase